MTTGPLLTRVVPPLPRRWRGKYLVERNLMATKAFWPVFLSGFFDPVFYLLAIGVGIGQLAGDPVVAGIPVDYTAFLAPAMLAASAMNGAIYESTNMFFKLKYGKIYDGILALPAAILIGFAFGAAGVAATTYMRTWQDLDLVTLVTLPLFLFSATFYPIDVYPEFIQIVTWVSPLYHGVVLIRGLTLGILEWTMLINIAYLAAWGIVGSMITARRIGVLLLK